MQRSLLWLALAGAVLASAQGARKSAPAQLPPVSWTCPMHPDIVDDQRGVCPICKMPLAAVRLVSVWTCPVHRVVEQELPGRCRICARHLVRVTESLTFTCAGHPEISRIDPGRCPDGSAAVAHRAARPHGDHNPKHGGLFFMAPDNWHHLEGAYPAAGRFRLYLYDDYSRPLPRAQARQVRGRLVTREQFDTSSQETRELASGPLVLARSGTYLEAAVQPLALPATVTAKIAFAPGQAEARFDFTFAAYSKDTAAPTSGAPTGITAPSRPSGATAASATRPLAAIVQELHERDREVAALVRDGNFGAIYVPALRAKDVALEIQERLSSTPVKTAADARVYEIVVAAYQLDNYGDLGDAEKIGAACEAFRTAVAALAAIASGGAPAAPPPR